MALSFPADLHKDITYDEFYRDGYTKNELETPTGNNTLVFRCEGKKRTIKTVLSGDFTLNVTSHWKDFISKVGGAVASKLIDALDNYRQGLSGISLRQPWFGRKIWEGTEPLRFTFPVRFVSFLDARTEVMQPVMDLLSLVHPRQIMDNNNKILAGYHIPGPSIFYASNTNSSGDIDRVEIQLGNFLHFRGCYITKIDLQFANSFSLEGWPHNVGGNVSFETMDVAYVEHNGAFMEEGFRDPEMELNSNLVALKNKVGGGFETVMQDGGAGLQTGLEGVLDSFGNWVSRDSDIGTIEGPPVEEESSHDR